MSRRGNCYDNAVMESLFSTIKHELGEHFPSAVAAKAALFDYLEVFYNQRRRHSTIGHVSPAAYERTATCPAAPISAEPRVVPGMLPSPSTSARRSWGIL